MKYAADFRAISRDALRGRWLLAIVVGLIASLLGGIGASRPKVSFDVTSSGAHVNLSLAGQTIYSTGRGLSPQLQAFLIGSILYIAVAALALAAVYFVLGSVIGVGYARFNLGMVDHTSPSFETLFSYFPHWKTTAAARLLQSLYILLWTLLLIVPGILAAYSYSMTEYILAEHPYLTASEAITRSKELMYGNRWRLFCLQCSFIGWILLCILTMGIGNLWLTPYTNTATAAFYREISGTALPD